MGSTMWQWKAWGISLFVGIGGITFALTATEPTIIPTTPAVPEASPALSSLNSLAKSITVRVFSGETWGSGIIIQRQGNVYTVLTNDHVLFAGEPPYRLQTADGEIYTTVEIQRSASLNGNDLALLQFRSTEVSYPVAKLGKTPQVSQTVVAVGFPVPELVTAEQSSEGEEAKITLGQVSLLLEQSLEGGYQIGYTNEIEKGMSGGPVLNLKGEVIAINGMHSYPIFGDPYIFQDGSEPSPTLRQRMIPLAFAIPIDKVMQVLPETTTSIHPQS